MVTRVDTATTAPASTASITPTLPTWEVNDIVVITVCGKYNTTTEPATPSGWTKLYFSTGGTGATGNDVGTTFQGSWYRIMQSGDTAPTFNAGATAPNSWEAIATSFRPGTGMRFVPGGQISSATIISDTNTASPLTGTATLSMEAGDIIYSVGNTPTDAATGLTSATHSHASVSGGTTTTGYVENALGNDTAAGWLSKEGWTGTVSSGNHTLTFTFSTGNMSGTIGLIALHEETDPGTTHTVTDSDDIGVTDTVALSQEKGKTENVGITDSFTARPHLITWSELSAQTWQQATLRLWRTPASIDYSTTDNVGVTDTNTRDVTSGTTHTQSPIDAVGITDTATAASTFNRSSTDSVGITDTQTIAVVYSRVSTDSIGITDSATVALSREVIAGFNVGITDTASIEQHKGKVESIGITDTFDIQRLLNLSESIGITDSIDIAIGRFQSASDSIGITDSAVFAFSKGFIDNVQVTDLVSMVQSKGFTDTVGITDSFTAVIPIRHDATDSVGITDTFDILLEDGDTEVPELSLVDEKRDAAIAYLVASAGAVELDLRKLTIEDIAHKYWSHKAGDYDNQALSILDHLRTNGFTGWDWLRQIT
jgi:hypothetical protein